jgi:hypothetical protein
MGKRTNKMNLIHSVFHFSLLTLILAEAFNLFKPSRAQVKHAQKRANEAKPAPVTPPPPPHQTSFQLPEIPEAIEKLQSTDTWCLEQDDIRRFGSCHENGSQNYQGKLGPSGPY